MVRFVGLVLAVRFVTFEPMAPVVPLIVTLPLPLPAGKLYRTREIQAARDREGPVGAVGQRQVASAGGITRNRKRRRGAGNVIGHPGLIGRQVERRINDDATTIITTNDGAHAVIEAAGPQIDRAAVDCRAKGNCARLSKIDAPGCSACH